MNLTLISFYTPDWVYPQHAARLRDECEQLGLDHRIVEKPSRGGYRQNCCIKPFFIRETLLALNYPVLWVDVDASIYKVPVFFDGMECCYDFAAKRIEDPRRRREWHVGTMWFNPTPATMRLMDAWCERTGNMTDESALNHTFKEAELDGLRWADIPKSYFRIGEHEDVVIQHRLSTGDSKRRQLAEIEAYERRVL